MGKSEFLSSSWLFGGVGVFFFWLCDDFLVISSGKKSKVRGVGGGDDLIDSSDADSVGSSSTALSDLSMSYATEHVGSQEFVLDKYIDALYEKR